jgi:hypothetical protein
MVRKIEALVCASVSACLITVIFDVSYRTGYGNIIKLRHEF